MDLYEVLGVIHEELQDIKKSIAEFKAETNMTSKDKMKSKIKDEDMLNVKSLIRSATESENMSEDSISQLSIQICEYLDAVNALT